MTSTPPETDAAHLARTSRRFLQPRSKLAAYRSRGWRGPDKATAAAIAKVRESANSKGDEALAKAAWILNEVAEAQDHYLRALQQIRRGEYYAGWCSLEQCEQRIHNLDRHFDERDDEFGIEFMRAHVSRFQELYPYGIFGSPEYIYKKITCGICSKPVTPRNSCGHLKGEIYQGHMCYHRIDEFEIAAVALVSNPVQKYSVIGAAGDDTDTNYNHTTVAYVAEALESPWDGWNFTRTKVRHPHAHFEDRDPSGPCPCESKANYEACCLPEAGVLRPHFQVHFDRPPRDGTPHFQFSDPR